jgi:hypothetical protein
MVGRVCPRHSHRGLPLNSVVRHQLIHDSTVSPIIAISMGIALLGVVLVAFGLRSSSLRSARDRAEKLHSAYVVADHSRLFLASGVALLIIGVVIAIASS